MILAHGRLLQKRRRLPRPPVIRLPDSATREYFRRLMRYLDRARAMVERHLGPLMKRIAEAKATRQDAAAARDPGGGSFSPTTWAQEVTTQMYVIKVAYWKKALMPDFAKAARRTAGEVSKTNKEQILKQFQAVLGVNPLLYEPGLALKVAQFVANNVALIVTLPQQYFEAIEEQVKTSVMAGRRHEAVAKDLLAEYKSDWKATGHHAEVRAALIARDQTLKFYGELTKSRQQDLGVTTYRWMTSRDERVRGTPGGVWPSAKHSHYLMDQKLCKWDNPFVWSLDNGVTWVPRPEDVPHLHPGQDYQCRCTAEPQLDALAGADVDKGALPQYEVPDKGGL